MSQVLPRAPRLARLLVVGATAGSLVAGCSALDETAERAERTAPASPSAAPAGSPAGQPSSEEPSSGEPSSEERLPERPADDVDALAGQVERVEAVLGDRGARPDAVRSAAHFQQRAARFLARSPERFRERVLARLDARAAAVTRRHVTAAAVLQGLTDPQPRLPDWRIVAPPAPRVLLGHYRAAERRLGVPWEYLAAIHLVETRMGRIRGTSSAGAQGPMQFIPSTWELHGAGGDINDPGDAIMAAARLLRAHGAPDDMARALYHYNPHEYYVRAVTEYATVMQEDAVAYRGYWHWRVLYRHERGTYVLPEGYPGTRARLLR